MTTSMLEGIPVSATIQKFYKNQKSEEMKVFVIKEENRFQLDPAFVAQYIGTQPVWGYGPISFITYKRSYARPLSKREIAEQFVRFLGYDQLSAMKSAMASTQTSEEYWQTCTRVVEGISSIIKQRVRNSGQPWSDQEEQHHCQAMFKLIWAFKFIPPGRGLWLLGSEAMEAKGAAGLNNCGFKSTEDIIDNFSEPFCFVMDMSMMGVGMGFDLLGANQVKVIQPATVQESFEIPDTREGWIEAVRIVLDAFTGSGTLPSFNYSKIRKEGMPLKTFGGTASGPGPLIRLVDSVIALMTSRVGELVSGTDITDIMNMIGACVVAGNVRRSAEIALGSPDDQSFIAAKDPTQIYEWQASQRAIAHAMPAWISLQKTIDNYKKKQAALPSVLHPFYLVYQERIDKKVNKQKLLLSKHEGWLALEDKINAHPLRTHRWASNNTVMCYRGMKYDDLVEQTITNGEPGYAWPEIFRAYGRLADPANYKDRDAKGFNPCGEQTLHDRELCCLVETNPVAHETLDDYLDTLKYAYRYAKAVTLVPTHNAKTNAVMVRNRRIGTSMAGIIEMYCKLGMQECIRWWDASYTRIRHWDAIYSGWMDVKESIKVTSIKPGGSTPLLMGVEGGMKAPIAPFYMRTIRIGHDSPLVMALATAGYRIEKDRTTPRTMVAYFPSRAPEGVRSARQISLWEQAAIFTALQEHWADNMVSATLTFRPEEAKDIARVIEAYEGKWKCVSFLPLMDHGFVQAPYIPCTENEFLAATAALKPLVIEGNVHDTEDKFCAGGLCERPVA